MKLKTTLKPKPQSSVVEVDQTEEIMLRLDRIKDDLDTRFVDRTTEIKALQLALMTGMHVMFEGPQGTGKSMLAEAFFNRIAGATTFHTQFTGATDRDEIFGPLLTERYRKDGICEHNIKGHLPTAHFFFADEVYRSSPAILSTMFGVLNERTFSNGSGPIKCPLITAVGTTNFESDDAVLDAFHDRWHLKVMIKPLSSANHLARMFSQFLAPRPVDKVTTLTLVELLALQEAVRAVKVDEQLIKTYAAMCMDFCKVCPSLQIPVPSDRRKALALRLVQASAVMGDRDKAEFSDLAVASYALLPSGVSAASTEWLNIFGREAANNETAGADNETLRRFRILVQRCKGRYSDPSKTSKAAIQALYTDITSIIDTTRNSPDHEKPKNPHIRQEFDDELQSAIELQDALRSDLSAK